VEAINRFQLKMSLFKPTYSKLTIDSSNMPASLADDFVATPSILFSQRYDFSRVVDDPPTTPKHSDRPVDCNHLTMNTCSWGCEKCIGIKDQESCKSSSNWALTFGTFQLR
jgi:hypothetical protein